MNIVHGGRIAFSERNNPRGGTFHYKRLVEGVPGSAGNFGLMLSRTFENFVSPRHRHNFEQIRFQIEGVSSFGRDGDMVPGTMGYFPEGAFYGPQSAEGPALVLVLQFGGPSGSGYMSEDELQASVRDLSRVGEFRGGVYYRQEGPGRARQDAYEAAWEHRNGRALSYPEPLYPAPVLVRQDAVAWQDSAPGVAERPLGTFRGGTAASIFKLEPQARHTICGPCVMFCWAGEGRVGSEAFEAQASIHLAEGEESVLSSDGGMEMLVMTLPRIAAGATTSIAA
jgi:hypothetical protein